MSYSSEKWSDKFGALAVHWELWTCVKSYSWNSTHIAQHSILHDDSFVISL